MTGSLAREQIIEALRDTEPELYAAALAAVPAMIAEYGENADAELRSQFASDLQRQLHAALEMWLCQREFTPDEREFANQVGLKRAIQGVSRQSLLYSITLVTRIVVKGLSDQARRLPESPELDAAVADLEHDLSLVEQRWWTVLTEAHNSGSVTSDVRTASELLGELLSGAVSRSKADLVTRGLSLGIDLEASYRVLLVAALDAGGSNSDRDQAVGAITRQAGLAYRVDGHSDDVEHTILVVPTPSLGAWRSVVVSARKAAAEHQVHVLATEASRGPWAIRASYREALALLPTLPQLNGKAGFTVFEDLMHYSLLAQLSPGSRSRYSRAILGDLTRLPPEQVLRCLQIIFACQAFGGRQKEASQSVGLSVRWFSVWLNRISEMTGRSPQDPQMWLAAVLFELDQMDTGPNGPADALGAAWRTSTAENRREGEDQPRSRLSPARALRWFLGRIRNALGLGLSGLNCAGVVEAVRNLVPMRVRGLNPRFGSARTFGLSVVATEANTAVFGLVLALSVGLTGLVTNPGKLAAQGSGVGGRPVSGGAASSLISTGAPHSLFSAGGWHQGGDAVHPGTQSGAAFLPRPESETPEDTVLYAAAPSPNYPHDHVVVALGVGRTCSCPVVMRSSDGGATWLAAPGPSQAGQVVLPPTYPVDPRIFIGNDPALLSPDFISPRFGEPYAPLAAPPGWLAVSQRSSAGAAGLFIAAQGGVWSYDPQTQTAQPFLLDGAPSEIPAIAAPTGVQQDDLFVLGSQLASPLDPSHVPDPLGRDSGLVLAACGADGACSTASRPNLDRVGGLVASPTYGRDHVLVALGFRSVLLSADAGRHLSELAMPAGGGTVVSVTLGSTSLDTPTIWLLLQNSGQADVYKRQVTSSVWTRAANLPVAAATPGGRLVALSGNRVLRLLLNRGFVCTTDAGATWTPRCSAETG